MPTGRTGLCILIVIAFTTLGALWAQESESNEESAWATFMPEALRRPERGESPRYPRDAVIGELGPGSATQNAYRFAQNVLNAILRGQEGSVYLDGIDTEWRQQIIDSIRVIEPLKSRLGGGREESEGVTSFLFRFIGKEKGIAGELYIKFMDLAWQFDDIIIEEPQLITGRSEGYRYDFTPYERFF